MTSTHTKFNSIQFNTVTNNSLLSRNDILEPGDISIIIILRFNQLLRTVGSSTMDVGGGCEYIDQLNTINSIQSYGAATAW